LGYFLPHVVLKGKTGIEEIFDQLKPVFFRNDTTILKTKEAYLEKGKKDILIDSLAIEGNRKTAFLALISGREDGVVVRLYPNMAVEKSDGVKRVLVELAKQIMTLFPEFTVGETNLSEYFNA
jgi:hypothetical protein